MLNKLFDGSFMPHGHCLLWRWDLLFLHVTGDLLTFTAYFIIPLVLIYLVRKRDDLKFDRIFLLFAAFIAFCGITHFMGLINIWHGYYYIEGIFKLATGLISLTTAIVLWKLAPKILLLPSATTLAQRNEELLKAKQELLEINQTLEVKIAERTNQLHVEANTDYLTGINNRRAIIKYLETEIERCSRYKRPCSIMMLDLDYFKQVNDKHGHQVGDNILVLVANAISDTCRLADHVGRYGGEEFLIVLPETSEPEALELAERIRQTIATLKLDIGLPLTVSIGVASLSLQTEVDSHTFIKQADDAVYKAKEQGRNQVVGSQKSMS
ncbi:GGDEF domain-containing protein [Paraglaciecola sp. 25GB23A]|uniref:GGDEF domain-containing protein n=1 Tax=Paraglaciecola sp. 25GB23A TaxID=3156068 RepID=UPI0032AFCB1B